MVKGPPRPVNLPLRPLLPPQVSMQYNPGWNGSSVNLLHVRAVGSNDTLHYVWSSIGAPAVLLVVTEGTSSALRVNWTQLLSPTPDGAIWIEPAGSVVYSTAVVFTKVPPRDSAVFPTAAKCCLVFYPTYDLSDFSWDSVNRTLNHTALTAEFVGGPATDPSGSFSNGSLAFRVTAYETSGRDETLPSLLHTANSSKVEFVLAGAAPRGNSSWFALEVATVEEAGVVQRLRLARSIDDEYTPTIFEVSAGRALGSTLSFLQWKATAYGSQAPKREDSIQCHSGSLKAANWTLPRSSIVLAYFGEGVGSTYTINAVNISFGGEDGNIYEEKRYLSWSALLGFGQPPKDTFSPLVISIMAVALGTPMVLLVVGSCVVLFAQGKRYTEYEPIN
uniref:Glycosylated lysosomal membrane protein n=1 Tax=Cairina moschata TaxID=8855 RepID=A0A8C3BWY5_CAIMO